MIKITIDSINLQDNTKKFYWEMTINGVTACFSEYFDSEQETVYSCKSMIFNFNHPGVSINEIPKMDFPSTERVDRFINSMISSKIISVVEQPKERSFKLIRGEK